MAILRLLVFSLMLAAPPLAADVLLIDAAKQGSSERELPRRGLTMRQVEQRFGTPQERIPAVGKPPITRWRYPGYTVYFEYQHVLHAVVQHDPLQHDPLQHEPAASSAP